MLCTHVLEVLNETPEIRDDPEAITLRDVQGRISFRDVTFSYDQKANVLENINLHVPEGTTVALVGRTGAGKTTMAALLSRFFDVDDGSLTIDGHDEASRATRSPPRWASFSRSRSSSRRP